LPSSDAFDVGLLSPVTVGHDAPVSDAEIAAAMVEVEVALARASARAGIAPESAAVAISAALDGWTPDAAELARLAVAAGNPIIPLVAALRTRVATADALDGADAASWVHRGATSQDVVDTALMLIANRALARVDASLAVAADALARLADGHRATVMAARTLTQQSTPTSFGLVAAGWLLGVVDARAGLPRGLPVQLGGASGTLASFVELGGVPAATALPGLLAEQLGLAAPTLPWHTRRGTITRLGDSLTSVIDSLGVIATDVATLGRTEIGELSETGGGGSSAMPQKQNPVRSVLIRSAAQRAPGLAAELHRSAATAVDQRPDGAWHAEWPALRELLRLALGASGLAAELLAGLRVDAERMRENLERTGPLIVAERLSLVLGPRLGTARVQDLVDRASAGADLAALLAAEPGVGDLDLGGLLDPTIYTGAADALIDAALAAHLASTA
jgi:3-carboxy-cis,cis-muconate cycloisomerase